MQTFQISPNDPCFFLHHSFVDLLWEDFRRKKQSSSQRETNYPTRERSCNSFHYANTTMLPFAKTNIEGLTNTFTDIFYDYEPRPSCEKVGSSPTCRSLKLYTMRTFLINFCLHFQRSLSFLRSDSKPMSVKSSASWQLHWL